MSKIIEFEEIIDASKNFRREIETRHGFGVDVEIDSTQLIEQSILEKIFSRPKMRVKGRVLPVQKNQISQATSQIDTQNNSLQYDEKKIIEHIQQSMLTTNIQNSSIKEKLQPTILGCEGLYTTVTMLEENDFSAEIINKVIEYAKKNLSAHELEDKKNTERILKTFFKKNIMFFDQKKDSKEIENQKIISLVGPTGVGKTTALLKLIMKLYVKEKNKKNIMLKVACLDYFKVGAMEQIQKIADIFSVKCSCIRNSDEIRSYIKTGKTKELYNLMLIDTGGHRVKDVKNEIFINTKNCLNAIKSRNEVLLVVSATTAHKNLKSILTEFSVHEYKAIVITKIDESDSIGAVISACIEHKIPIAYLGFGSESELEQASLSKIIKHINGITV